MGLKWDSVCFYNGRDIDRFFIFPPDEFLLSDGLSKETLLLFAVLILENIWFARNKAIFYGQSLDSVVSIVRIHNRFEELSAFSLLPGIVLQKINRCPLLLLGILLGLG